MCCYTTDMYWCMMAAYTDLCKRRGAAHDHGPQWHACQPHVRGDRARRLPVHRQPRQVLRQRARPRKVQRGLTHASGVGTFLEVSSLYSMCMNTLWSLVFLQALRTCAHLSLLPCSSISVSGVCAILIMLSLDGSTGMSGTGTLVCLFLKSSACVITPSSLLMGDGRHAAGLRPCQVSCRLADENTRSSWCVVNSAACGTTTLGFKPMLATIVTLHTLDPACASCPSMWSFTNVAVLKAVQVLPSSTPQDPEPQRPEEGQAPARHNRAARPQRCKSSPSAR